MFYASLPVLSALVSAIKAAQNGDSSHLSLALALFDKEQKEQSTLSDIADSVPSDSNLTIDGSSLVLPNGDGYDVMCWHYLSGKKNESTDSKHKCPHCSADLTIPHSIIRRYTEKRGDDYCEQYGHLSDKGLYKHDTDVDLSHGSFDLLDDSDCCGSCHQMI